MTEKINNIMQITADNDRRMSVNSQRQLENSSFSDYYLKNITVETPKPQVNSSNQTNKSNDLNEDYSRRQEDIKNAQSTAESNNAVLNINNNSNSTVETDRKSGSNSSDSASGNNTNNIQRINDRETIAGIIRDTSSSANGINIFENSSSVKSGEKYKKIFRSLRNSNALHDLKNIISDSSFVKELSISKEGSPSGLQDNEMVSQLSLKEFENINLFAGNFKGKPLRKKVDNPDSKEKISELINSSPKIEENSIKASAENGKIEISDELSNKNDNKSDNKNQKATKLDRTNHNNNPMAKNDNGGQNINNDNLNNSHSSEKKVEIKNELNKSIFNNAVGIPGSNPQTIDDIQSGMNKTVRVYTIKAEEFAQNTLQIVNSMPADSTFNARMILKPDSLGMVFVEIALNNNNLKLNLKADSEEVVRNLENQLVLLKEKLGNQGLNVEKIELGLKTSEDNWTESRKNNNGQKKEELEAREAFVNSFKNLNEFKDN